MWSVSLDRSWSRCQRQYFFQYKMANTLASDEQRRHAQFLNGIVTAELWQGKLVHTIIETAILPKVKIRNWPRPELIIPQAIALAKKQFAFSRNKKYESTTKNEAGADYCILASHYFETQDGQEYLDMTIDVVSRALRNLLSSEQIRAFLMGRQHYRVEKSFYFSVGEAKVKAVPDLVITNKKRGGIDIVDWKVANTSTSYDFQLAVYGLAVKSTEWPYNDFPGELYGYVINLLEPEPEIALADPYKLTDDILAAIIDIIYEKIERIDALVKGKKFDQLNIEDFKFARSVGTCALCNWQSMCVEMSNGSPAEFLPNNQSKPTQLNLPLI